MPRPIRPWFRVYVETFTDRKILRLTPAERWLWMAILAAARESPRPGHLLVSEGEAMTDAELSRYADVPPSVVRSGLAKMVRLGMMAEDGGVRNVINWSARQFESDNVTERTRDHRNRSREQVRNVPTDKSGTPKEHRKERSNVVPGNVPDARVTEADTEADTPPSLRSAPSQGAVRGTRLPEGWRPPTDVIAAIRAEMPTATSEQLERQHRKFVDHWAAATGRTATKRDWTAAWRNWMREAADRGHIGGKPPINGHGYTAPGGFDPAAALAAAHAADNSAAVQGELL